MSLFVIALILVGGVWCGVVSPKGWRSAVNLSVFAVVWTAIALALFAFCERVTLIDLLLVRYVGDDACLFGGFETRELAITYILVIAAAIVAIRTVVDRHNANVQRSDI